jgi:tetratricopeptide (TPR) repeat protein
LNQVRARISFKKDSSFKPLFIPRFDSDAIYKILALTLFLHSTPYAVNAQSVSTDSTKRSLVAAAAAPLPIQNQHKLSSPAVTKKSYVKKALRKKVQQSYPRTHMEKGYYLKQKNDLNGALLEFLKATQTDPHQVKGFYEQALIFRTRGYRKLAESSLEQALAIEPKYNEARVLLATIRLEQGNLGGAVQELTKSLGLDLGSATGAGSNESKAGNDTTKNSLQPNLIDSGASNIFGAASASSSSIATVASGASGASNSSTAGSSSENSQTKSSTSQSSNNTSNSLNNNASGLLSIDIPAILQSIHGAIKSPLWFDERTADDAALTTNDSKTSSEAKVLVSDSEKHDDSGEEKPEKTKQKRSKQRKVKGKKVKEKKVKSTHSRNGKDDLTSSEESIAATASTSTSTAASTTALPNTKLPPAAEGGSKNSEQLDLAALLRASNNATEHANTTHQEAIAATEQKGSFTPNVATDDATILANVKREANSIDDKSPSSRSEVATQMRKTILGENATFNINQNSRPVAGILSNILAAPSQSAASSSEKQATARPAVKLDDDDWAKRLKNYADHGANSLKNGEAFMFAEDTGEASLFLADGTTIRRIIAQPKDSEEVMRERRPDIVGAEDMLYGLSLLGKLIPKFDSQPQANAGASGVIPQPTPQSVGGFTGDNLMSGTQSFWGWLKSVCKI